LFACQCSTTVSLEVNLGAMFFSSYGMLEMLCLHNQGLVKQLVKHAMKIVFTTQRNSTQRLLWISVPTFASVALRGWISKPVGDSVE